MTKLQIYSEGERTVIFDENSDAASSGVIVQGKTVTHVLQRPEVCSVPGENITTEEALQNAFAIHAEDYACDDNRDTQFARLTPTEFAERSEIFTLKDGTQVLALPPEVPGVSIDEAIAGYIAASQFDNMMRSGASGELVSTKTSNADMLTDPRGSPISGLDISPKVIGAMKKYAMEMRLAATNEQITEIRPDAGKRGGNREAGI